MANSGASNFFAEFRTIVFATIVTALIWIWAEGESVSSLSVPIRITVPDGRTSDLVLNSPGLVDHSMNVVLRFEGSTLSVDSATALRGATLALEAGTPGLPTQAGANQVIDLRKALASHPDIAKLSVPLTSVEPEALVVDSVRLATRELPVRVELAREVALAADPVPSIARVRVRFPESLASRVPTSDVQVVAFISDDQLLNLRGEGSETVKATCRLPAALADIQPIRFQPDTIPVTIRVRQALESTKLATTVPVWFSLPPTEDSRSWEIEVLDKFLSDLTVTGPAEQIARVSRPNPAAGSTGTPLAVKALIELTSDDLNNASSGKGNGGGGGANGGGNGASGAENRNFVLTKTLIFTGLPPNVTVVGSPTARVRITRAAGAAMGPPTPPPGQGAGVQSPKPAE